MFARGRDRLLRLFRIGDKVVSENKLHDAIAAILAEREAGATQEDVARRTRSSARSSLPRVTR